MGKALGRLYSAALDGIDAKIIEVEADINVGLHSFNIVGLGDRSLTEAKERVNSALKNSGIKPPNRENRKITINLAPADIRKAGSHYDLAIAIGYLLATKQIHQFTSDDKLFLGELALDGRLRPVNGVLNIAEKAAREGYRYILLPEQNANEAAAITNIDVIGLECLSDAIAFLEKRREFFPAKFTNVSEEGFPPDENFSDIAGQGNAKRAFVIAAAGRHNIALVGPPGVGKTFLSRAFAGILPDLSSEEAIETTKVWSAAGLSPGRLMFKGPFRAPHHSASMVALIGGGTDPKPGEVSLAHHGVLFLDEFPEFPKNAIEALRQPMESGTINLARSKGSILFPAKFILVAAMNPCPCGYFGDPGKECLCSAYEIIRYQKRLSGPILDRIDLQVKIGRVTTKELRAHDSRTDSAALRDTVIQARALQSSRFSGRSKGKANADMTNREVQAMTDFEKEAVDFLEMLKGDHLSPRAYYRTIKIARTIADLDQKEKISAGHIAEAFSYRLKEMF